MKEGDKVRLKKSPFGRYCLGVIEWIDGDYLYVKMNYRGILCQLYRNEISKC